ncbi:MAG: IclR family transcriptional regulator [Pseudomonadota bacterium]
MDQSKAGIKPTASEPPRSGIQVIARAAAVLRALEDEPNGLSLGEIASRVDLARSTVQRIVAALADEQFLIAATPKSRVKLGPALIRLASATKLELNQLVRPYMESLSRELNETIDLSVIQGKAAVFIDQITGNHRLRAVSAVGERFPLHSTACGKSLLATLPPEKLDRLIRDRFERFTENTITNEAILRKEIQKVKKQSVAYDLEENTEGICAISVSFTDPIGRAYALSIPTPATRFSRNKKKFKDALFRCREEIVEMLGNNER